uniref:Sushi domain-containing protein n=1 Tax=Chelydra serpentina TaxID=8475 RepID=A0A8C3RL90_CHESE
RHPESEGLRGAYGRPDRRSPGRPATSSLWVFSKVTMLFLFFIGGCGIPPRLTFAELQNEFTTQADFPGGTTVRYNCRSGYQKVPGVSPTLTCERESVWSEPRQFCRGKLP